jgi:hypothetical protein
MIANRSRYDANGVGTVAPVKNQLEMDITLLIPVMDSGSVCIKEVCTNHLLVH